MVRYIIYETDKDGNINAYVNDAPKIIGTGKTKCEALEDLVNKYRAILHAVDVANERKDCDV